MGCKQGTAGKPEQVSQLRSNTRRMLSPAMGAARRACACMVLLAAHASGRVSESGGGGPAAGQGQRLHAWGGQVVEREALVAGLADAVKHRVRGAKVLAPRVETGGHHAAAGPGVGVEAFLSFS